MQDIKFCSETVVADQSAADLFHAELLRVMKAEGSLAKQVFNPYKLGIYWKQIPARTFNSLCAAVDNPELKVVRKHRSHHLYLGSMGRYQGIHCECCLEENVVELCS
jgi:hypothetical protein